jgi:non-specific protein-tyrosine kinase
MGKIFKALEKAEKENVPRPSQRPAANRLRPDMKTARPQVKDRPSARMDPQRRPPDPAQQDREPVKPPTDAIPAERVDPRPATEPLPPTVEPAIPPVERTPAHRLETGPVHESSRLEKKSPPPVESKPAIQADSSSKPDSVNIALVKPEAPEPLHPVERTGPRPEAGVMHMRPETRDQRSGKTLRVKYSKTKVQVNDPEKLRNNKIFSIFDEMETTDQIKILRTQILKKLKSIGGNTILVTSANPYEGKTFTSINLGVSIAKEFDRTVLIIDADLRKPTKKHTAFSTEFFSLNVEKGLTDYLMGEVEIPDVLINPGIAKLTLIPGGKPVYNAPELLNSLRMEEMMADIKSRYSSDRLVIVDGPAILPFPDAVILSRYVDGVLPVVEIEKTSTEDLKKMMDRLNGVRVLGTVLNKNKG